MYRPARLAAELRPALFAPGLPRRLFASLDGGALSRSLGDARGVMLALALQMLGPGRGSALDIIADLRAGRKIGRGVTVVTSLVVAQRQQRHLVRMDALDQRRLRLLGMCNVSSRSLDALQRIVGAWRGEAEHVAEIGGRLVALGEGIETKAQFERLQHRGVIDGAAFGPKHGARRDPRRDQKVRNADAEPLEVDVELADRVVGRRCVRRGGDMIVIAAMLVVGDQKKRVVPARTVSHRVIGVVNQLLAQRHVVVGMLAVAAGAEARLEKGVGRKRAGVAPGLESRKWPKWLSSACMVSVKSSRVSGSRL